MFFKTASVPVIAVYQSSGKFSKCASKSADISKDEDKSIQRSINLISQDVLNVMARIYNLSNKIDDFVFPIPRAVTASVPNMNGDMFEHEELINLSPKHRCLVYQTFRNDPLHIEHVANDPKAARGFLPDSFYVQDNPKDRHVIAVAAVDTTKDGPLAEGILSGDINSFSMGCICDSVVCSNCNKTAHSDKELCDCLLHHKMNHINGKLVYEKCKGVEYQELSVVGQPADETAHTQAILQLAARESEKVSTVAFRAVSSMLTQSEQVELAKYVKANINHLPKSLLKLINKLF